MLVWHQMGMCRMWTEQGGGGGVIPMSCPQSETMAHQTVHLKLPVLRG